MHILTRRLRKGKQKQELPPECCTLRLCQSQDLMSARLNLRQITVKRVSKDADTLCAEGVRISL